MNRAERRRRTRNIIKKRKEKIKYFNPVFMNIEDAITNGTICEGQLRNNNDMNRLGGGGVSRKTKAKHSHSTYRHKGAYGKAIQYKPHDQRQIDQELDQEENE